MKLGCIVFVLMLCHFCCCVVVGVTAKCRCYSACRPRGFGAVLLQHLRLAILFQRLLGMVPKWIGSPTNSMLAPIPVHTQERMEK
jgi:hypothetical protein